MCARVWVGELFLGCAAGGVSVSVVRFFHVGCVVSCLCAQRTLAVPTI